MKHLKKTERKIKPLLWVNIALAAAAALLLCLMAADARTLRSQQAAQRWRGGSDTPFAQVSCFIPVEDAVSVTEIYSFRTSMIEAMKAASLEVNGEEQLWNDAWSTEGKVSVSSGLGSGEAHAIAVGGDFFNFHPLRLVSGSYILPGDLMQDRVLLDRDLAWLLFGSTDIQGLSFEINGADFIVAGVYEPEDDFASRKAMRAGMTLYMSYDAYSAMKEDAGINNYELVMADPVSGFAENTVREKFRPETRLIVENSARFKPGKLLSVAGSLGERGMQTAAVIYPYWENAARYAESRCALLLCAALACLLLPVLSLAFVLVRCAVKGKTRLEEDILPAAREKAEEAIRVRQRAAWEKRNPGKK